MERESFIGRSFDAITIKAQYRKRMFFFAAAFFGIAICATLFYFGYHWFLNRSYDSYEVLETVSVKDSNSMNYVSYEDGLIRYGRDGVTAVDGKGNSLWSGSYDMANPSIDTCESAAVVADIGDTSLYVYKGDDTGTDFSVDYPIVQACVSKQGVIAVLWEENSSNTIALYNPFDSSDTLLAEIPTNVEDGYPIGMDLSPDGSSVVVSYLDASTGVAQSRVAFYNFSDVGENSNYLVGANNYEETLISEIQFLDNSNVCLFGENGFYIWQNMKQPEAVVKKEFSKEIRSAFCGEGYVGVILNETDDSARMKLYNTEGKKTLSVKVSSDYNTVQAAGSEILFYSGQKCVIYRTNGVKKFSKSMGSQMSYFFSAGKRNRYFIVQDSKIKIIRLK